MLARWYKFKLRTPGCRVQGVLLCGIKGFIIRHLVGFSGKVRDCDLLTAPGPAEEGQMLQAGPGVGVCSPGILCTE